MHLFQLLFNNLLYFIVIYVEKYMLHTASQSSSIILHSFRRFGTEMSSDMADVVTKWCYLDAGAYRGFIQEGCAWHQRI